MKTKRFLGVFLTLTMIVGLLPAFSITASSAQEPVSYIEYSWDEETGKLTATEKTITEYTLLEGNCYTYGNSVYGKWTNGWYVVKGDAVIKWKSISSLPGDLNVYGDNVNLILTDGSSLSTGTIDLRDENTLNIYGQKKSDGKLIAKAINDWYPGIGIARFINDHIKSNQSGGILNIHGGDITAISKNGGAGIGSGGDSNKALSATGYHTADGAKVTVYGGKVTATGTKRSAGIGSGGYWHNTTIHNALKGKYAAWYGGSLTVYGGSVMATGAGGGAGIGGGEQGSDADVKIYDGIVIANGYTGIGEGKDRQEQNKGSKAITGGIVFENGNGKMYADTVTASHSFEIPIGITLTVDSGKTLVIGENATVTVNGEIENNGTIINNGAIIVTAKGAYTHNGTYTGNGNLELNGTFNNEDNFTVGGDFTASGNLANSGTLTVKGKFTNNGTLTNSGTLNLEKSAVNNGTLANENTLVSKESFINQGVITGGGSFSLSGYAENNGEVPTTAKNSCTHFYYADCDENCNFCGFLRTAQPHDINIYDYCNVCGLAEEPKMENGQYMISSPGNLLWFSYLVNGEKQIKATPDAQAVLSDNIRLPYGAYPSIGTDRNPFCGIFEGNGHTITLWDELDYTPQNKSLFGVTNGATIKNLTVSGGVVTNEAYAGGVIGKVAGGENTLQNCVSQTNLAMNTSSGYVGGLVGFVDAGSISIENSGYTGKISGRSSVTAGGLVGFANGYVSAYNAFTAAAYQNDFSIDSDTLCGNSSNISFENCYYVNALGTPNEELTQISDGAISSGELCYKLCEGGGKWYQNIDNDKYPKGMPYPNSAYGTVYYSYKDCDATEKTYRNTKGKDTQGHDAATPTCTQATWCSWCHKTVAKNLDNHTSEDTRYAYIDNSQHALVHACCGKEIERENHTTGKTENGVTFCSVCNFVINAESHEGTIEWYYPDSSHHVQRYSCCGLYLTAVEEHDLTYQIDEANGTLSAECSECHSKGTLTLSVSDKEYDGKISKAQISTTGIFAGNNPVSDYSVIYCCEGGCKNAGTHTVTLSQGELSFAKAFTISPKTITVESVSARTKYYDGTPNVEVTEIKSSGKVIYDKGQYEDYEFDDIADDVGFDVSTVRGFLSGSIPGDYSEITISNAYLTGADSENYVLANATEGRLDNIALTNENGYDFTLYAKDIHFEAHDQIVRGSDAIDQTAYTVSGVSSNFEISNVTLVDDGTTISVNTDNMVITNSGTDVTEYFEVYYTIDGNLMRECANHKLDMNGFCAAGECNSYDVPELFDNGTDYEYDDFYKIENAGQLYWYADRVNNYNCQYGMRLEKNITVNADMESENLRAWTPINQPKASIDGNGYTISGLYVNTPDEDYAGFVGYGGYYDITNLRISDSFFYGRDNVGAIAGSAGGIITGCEVTDTVTVKGSTDGWQIGGIAGNFDGSSFDNNISFAELIGNSEGDNTGGLVGDNSGSISNSFTNYKNAVLYHSESYGAIENVFYIGEDDDYDGTTATNEEELLTGKIAYLLQSGIYEEYFYDEKTGEEFYYTPEIWGQSIGENSYPSLGGSKVYEVTDCKGNTAYSNTDEANQHFYEDADCDTPKTCTVCGITDGNALGHEYENGVCIRCGEVAGNVFAITNYDADTKTASVIAPEAGTYTVIFADYEGEKLANIEYTTITFTEETKGTALIASITKGFSLAAGDKIMLWSDMIDLVPMGEAYILK